MREDDEDEPDEIRFGPYRLAVSVLATAPLFVAYELGLLASERRNVAELLASRSFEPFGDQAPLVRMIVVACGLLAALWFAVREERERLFDPEEELDEEATTARRLLGRVLRQIGEGALAALCMGPLLVLALSLFDVTVAALEPGMAGGQGPPPLSLAARIAGGAAWEELVFRLGAYAALFLLTVRLVHFFGVGLSEASPAGDLIGLLGSATLFAGFHLEALTRFFGVGGEPFDSGIFLWRLLAGLVLATLFRWRGLGVAAWAHAIFNLALLLGSGPGVFRGP